MPGVKGRRATRGKFSAGKYNRYYKKSGGTKKALKDSGAHVYISRLFDRPSQYVFIPEKGQFTGTTGGLAYKEAIALLNQFNPRMTEGIFGNDVKLKGVVATLKVVSGSPEYIDRLRTSTGGSIMAFAHQRALEILREKTKHIL